MKLKAIVVRFFKSPFHTPTQVMSVIGLLVYSLLATGSGWGYFGSVRAPNFVPAFIFTFIMALGFAIYAHEVNHRFQYLWQSGKKMTRWLMQFCLGVAVPLVIELIAVEIFFWFQGESILSNNFFDIDFILVTFYILLLHSFYAYTNFNQRVNQRMKVMIEQQLRPALRDLSVLRRLHQLEAMRCAPLDLRRIDLQELDIDPGQVACAYRLEDELIVRYFDAREEVEPTAIGKFFERFDPQDYIRINPWCFYHRLLIYSYTEKPPSRRISLELRVPFNRLTHDKQLIVSQSLSRAFKKWMSERT